MSPGRVAGVLLAAGAGTRMGMPKALVRDNGGTSWLVRAAAVLAEGGCDSVTVVLGAGADEARLLVPESATAVVAPDWAEGMSASLRTGLHAVAGAELAVVTLVDLPDVTADVVRRVVEAAGGPEPLLRATYAGRPGHPVVLGRGHWAGVLGTAQGDQGARDYLAAAGVTGVECGDLASGRDFDHSPDRPEPGS